MIAEVIRWILMNTPSIFFVTAIVVAWLTHGTASRSEHFLAWLLLLPVGADSLWAGIFHVFFPQTASSYIGWQVSPFQFEIGVADMAIGLTGIVSFWRSLEFKSAVVMYISLFYIGVAIGHVHQAVSAHDFATGNFGVLLLITLVTPVLLIWLLALARRDATPRTDARLVQAGKA